MSHTSLLPIKRCGGHCLAPVSSRLSPFSPVGVIRAQSLSALQPLLSSRLAGDHNVLRHPRLPLKVSKSPGSGSLKTSLRMTAKRSAHSACKVPALFLCPTGGRPTSRKTPPSELGLTFSVQRGSCPSLAVSCTQQVLRQ